MSDNEKDYTKDVAETEPEIHSPEKQEKKGTIVSMGYSGPIPTPQFMEGYKNVLPDAPDRILKMAEKQTECMVRDSKLQMYEMFLSNISSVVITLLIIAFAFYMVYNDKPHALIVPVMLMIPKVVNSFRKSTEKDNSENEQKK